MASSIVTLMGVPGITATVLSTDTSQILATATAYDSTKQLIGVYLYLETFGIRYAWGTAPVVATPLGHALAAGQTLILHNPEAARLFRFISAVAGSHGRLQVTYLYKY